MSQELIYTSAPRGLKPGSQGFCTVVQTQGVSTSLAQRLEALSGYRHVFSPPDPNCRLNPVLFSHLIVSLAGRRCHILSRVCDAGLDHTQRTNKFAHHVVLDPAERVPGGPAWLLAAAGFMQSTWDGVPKVLAAGRCPPAGNSAAAVCRAWQQVTGDAGWGGALAETARPGASRLAVIIYRPGVAPLPLLAESLALLPPESRWNVSFCTYFTKLPPGIDCQWRCVLDGSPEAIANQRLPGALVIDLGKPRGAAPSSPLVQAARTGVAQAASAPVSRPKPAVAGAYRASDAELAQLLAVPAPPPAPVPGLLPSLVAAPPAVDAYEAEDYRLAPPLRTKDAMDISPSMPRQFNRKPRSKWPMIAFLAATVVVLLASIAAIWTLDNRSPKEVSKASSGNGAQSSAAATASAPPTEGTAKSTSSGAAKQSSAPPVVPEIVSKQSGSVAISTTVSTDGHNGKDVARSTSSVQTKSSTAAQPASVPNKDAVTPVSGSEHTAKPVDAQANVVKTSQPSATLSQTINGDARREPASNEPQRHASDFVQYVTLPKNNLSSTLDESKSAKPGLMPFWAEDLSSVTKMELNSSNEGIVKDKALFTLKKGASANGTSTNIWKCGRPSGDTSVLGGDPTFAFFTASKDGLSFRWKEGQQIAADHDKLRDHFLFLTIKDRVRVLALRKPNSCKPISLEFFDRPTTSERYPLNRFGLPTDADHYLVKTIRIDRGGGNASLSAVQWHDIPKFSGRLKVGSSQPAVFSVTIRAKPARDNTPGFVVVVEYKGVMLENREIWRSTAHGRLKLAGLNDSDPVPIYPEEIKEFCETLRGKKAEVKEKKGASKSAHGEKKELIEKRIRDLEAQIANDFTPVELLAGDLWKEFSELKGLELQYQACVKLCEQEIPLFTSLRWTPFFVPENGLYL